MELFPVERVFSHPELLEAILLNLSLQDVLVNAQRITHLWNAIIKSSPALQQHLFFVPVCDRLAHESPWIKNTLLARKFPAWLRDIRTTGRFYIDVNAEWYTGHPGPYRSYHFHDIRYLNRSDWDSYPNAYTYPNASWRQMLVLQAAVKLLKIVHANLLPHKWRKTTEVRSFPSGEGLRMGFLYDLVIKEIDETYIGFGIQWNMFDEIEDSVAIEYQGDREFLSDTALMEKQEKEESVTLILQCERTDQDGRPRRRSR